MPVLEAAAVAHLPTDLSAALAALGGEGASLDSCDFVVLLRRVRSGAPVAYAGLKVVSAEAEGHEMRLLEVRGGACLRARDAVLLAGAASRLAGALKGQRPDVPLYALLGAGARFAGLAFREYFPREGAATPARTQALLDAFASARFPGAAPSLSEASAANLRRRMAREYKEGFATGLERLLGG